MQLDELTNPQLTRLRPDGEHFTPGELKDLEDEYVRIEKVIQPNVLNGHTDLSYWFKRQDIITDLMGL